MMTTQEVIGRDQQEATTEHIVSAPLTLADEHAEVLRQAGDEEWLLFPAGHPARGFARLERDHDRLRAGTEVLEQAAAGTGVHSRAQAAAVARIMRLHSGEQVELRSARDPEAVWRRVDQIRPGGYGFAYLQDGPAQWRVQVMCRPTTQPANGEG